MTTHANRYNFNIVLTSSGRPTLQRMVDSIAPQLTSHDYLTILWDSEPHPISVPADVKYLCIKNPEPLGYWGHASRNKWLPELPGDFFLHGDDDDVYLPGAMEVIRSHVDAPKLFIFRFVRGELIKPPTIPAKIAHKLIGTPSGVHPRVSEWPVWGLFHGGDAQFYQGLEQQLPVQFVDHVIYRAF